MTELRFFVGIHQPSDARRFKRVCISISRLWKRKKPIDPKTEVIVDSRAFMELFLYGEYRVTVEQYATALHRLWTEGVVNIAIAVAQDFMCEPFMLAKTKATGASDGTIADHQRLTIERYDALLTALCNVFRVNHPDQLPFKVMPVLQGYAPADYVRHALAYGDRLKPGMWVGVGSVCKRNSVPERIAEVLRGLTRFGFLLHGFGVKLTALLNSEVRDLLATADSMAWSYAARKAGRSPNSWKEAAAFVSRIEDAIALPRKPYQLQLFEAA